MAIEEMLQNCISWDSFTGPTEGFDLSISGAELDRENNSLRVGISLDFVVPPEDDARIKDAILKSVDGVSDVELKYDYRAAGMRSVPADTVRFFVERYVAGLDAGLRYAIDTEQTEITEDRLVVIKVIGGLSLDMINQVYRSRISNAIREKFGLDYDVRFEFSKETHEKVRSGLDLPAAELAKIAEADAASEKKTRKRASGTRQPGRKVILGKPFEGEPVPIRSLTPELGEVVVRGQIFGIDTRPINDKKILAIMKVTDCDFSTCVKAFLSNKRWEQCQDELAVGGTFLFKGKTGFSVYDNELEIVANDIMKVRPVLREDTHPGAKRVELHCHTRMSAMDALNDPERLVDYAARWGQKAIAITDHGVVQSFPDAYNEKKALAKDGKDVKVIYGMEGYLLPDEGLIADDGTIDYKARKTNHIILLAKNQTGLHNLYKLVSVSHIDYFYKKPRIPRSVLTKHRDGLILGSACEAGELFQAVEHGASDAELERVASYYDYLEIQPLVNNKFLLENGVAKDRETLQNFNRRIVALADRMGKPVVATTDAHYDEPESAIVRNIIMAGMGYKDAESGRGLYLRTTDEMLEEFSYLGEEDAKRVVIDNTNKIADMIDPGVKPVPDEKCPPSIEGAEETLRKTCLERAHSIYGDPLPKEIEDRLMTELNSIIGNGYAVMYVSAQMLVKKSNEDGYLVGSRGSVGSSFAATMAGITEVNPLDPHYICPSCKYLEWGDKDKYDCGIDMPEKKCPRCGRELRRDGFTIPFATFLGFEGNKEPDIDLNFAGEYQPRAHKYVGKIFGEKNVYKAGTVSTIADATAYGYVMKFFEETGRPVNKYEVERLKAGCTGVKRTTGQHPGGIIIVPDDHDILEFCPIQRPANDTTTDIVTTHFDYHKIDKNLLKLDILGHNVPSMIRQLQDMTGIDPMDVDLTDKKVLSIFNGIEALDIKTDNYRYKHGSFAIPEFGTPFVRKMLDDVKPSRFEDLIRMSGFSHGTDVWTNNAQDYIRNGVATMREVISTRDDIMNYCMLKGIDNERSFQIMENVRKKNRVLTEDDIKVMKEHNIPDWYIDSCAKIKYMFPRAHAVAYVMMSFRLAWYKVYYPLAFYATFFTSVGDDFDADLILKGSEACADRAAALEAKGSNANAKEKTEMMIAETAYEMYARGYEFLDARLGRSDATKFGVLDGKVILPFSAYNGVGAAAATGLYEAYKEKPFDTIEEAVNRSGINKSACDTMREHGVFGDLPERAQMSWDLSEAI